MSEFITSQANPRVKAIRKLHERKERQQTGLFYVEGLRLVGEAVQLNAPIQYLVVAPYLLVSPFAKELLATPPACDLPRMEVSQVVFETFALKEGPQGIGAVVQQRWLPLEEVIPSPGSLWVALDSVADPGNLGAILRTSDAVGAEGVILLDNATDPYDPTAVRASMGAIFSQKLVKATTAEFTTWQKMHGCRVVGASGAASVDYHHYPFPDPCVLLMGSERQGLHADQLAICDQLISIPMTGRSDSLNLAVATAIVLYEIFNQRRDKIT
jgi:TrmH family RNA methyltransferase